ncbi:NAD(P)H-dependent glycerol-3-phosphate dehydrogenase [Salinisphaera sp. P385]|uniref:Glycerol-3-phosphate dehydrogenase [NAD(P)+] n=1 Tax=Spectribacter acetivorans TaxID=3075603 RepID=A0ABU3BAT2_9GAMM|nr:NAD(P)H-dependent glycerol-3-phosphate dehydrogenase [Salinisphaera sp. P385]MDT0619566.1 NAD(P)H-dependent glycerol-3-phosphate dehydrogenase [Salinisphaera sp. P385]
MGIQRMAALGAGSWGTALAIQLARNGVEVRLWGRDAEAINKLQAARENQRYLPGAALPPALIGEPDLAAAVAFAENVLVTVPSHALRETLAVLQPHLRPEQRLILATKGLEPGSARLPFEVAAEVLGEDRPVSLLSGPSFAGEVGRGLPTAVTIASNDATLAADMARAFHDGVFRVYVGADMAGVAVGGAVKNVLAIAVGISDGLGYGANARALLITRGLSEMVRLGEPLGGRRETFMGMAGLGDLLLTCTDDQSRNRRMGLALAAGRTVAEAEADIQQVVEGVRVAREVHRIAEREGVELPICEQVYSVLHADTAPPEAVRVLTERPFRNEID